MVGRGGERGSRPLGSSLMSIDSLRVRDLSDGDLEAVNAFLLRHADSSMFLLNNVRNAGLEYSARRGSAEYWGAFGPDGALTGVIAHCWNGDVLVQAPEAPTLSALVDALASEADRSIAGALGDDDQVQAVLDLVGGTEETCALHACEALYALGLNDLRGSSSCPSPFTPSPPPHPNPPPPGVLWKNVGNTIPVGFTEVPAPALAELITTKLELTALELKNLQGA